MKRCEHCGAELVKTIYYTSNNDPKRGPVGRWVNRNRTREQWEKKRFCPGFCAASHAKMAGSREKAARMESSEAMRRFLL